MKADSTSKIKKTAFKNSWTECASDILQWQHSGLSAVQQNSGQNLQRRGGDNCNLDDNNMTFYFLIKTILFYIMG